MEYQKAGKTGYIVALTLYYTGSECDLLRLEVTNGVVAYIGKIAATLDRSCGYTLVRHK